MQLPYVILPIKNENDQRRTMGVHPLSIRRLYGSET